ncbi:membrane protein [Thermincola ferriacetica]|uniref:Membrane protein n=1 Tax=Thermincola ferriacetica TaxID=281456 RepID=A0A0L6W4M7_9FIRM|nr:hypothetical protein [Thermincola ferriacetica]KNZ70532.1 membrane protein [Thermincola ferriacetica]
MNQHTEKKLSPFLIAATYIGTVVGAGFASGQEVLQFFGFFGPAGILGMLLTSVLFAFFGRIIMQMGKDLQAKSHLPVIQKAGGLWIGRFIDYTITFFLFGAVTAMVAGSGAIFEEQFGIPSIWGNLAMAVATMITVLIGFGGVVSAISFVVPLLLAAVLGISIYTLIGSPVSLWRHAASIDNRAAVPFWPLSALIYVSYNLVMAIAVLSPLGMHAESDVALARGAKYGGYGLGLGALAILLALLANLPEAARYDIPMAFIAGKISPIIKGAYALVLLAEIYTTAVGSLYGFSARLADPDSARAKWVTIGAAATSLLASRFGFTNLVRFLYPVVGYAGLLLLAGLAYSYFRERLFYLVPALRKREYRQKNK